MKSNDNLPFVLGPHTWDGHANSFDVGNLDAALYSPKFEAVKRRRRAIPQVLVRRIHDITFICGAKIRASKRDLISTGCICRFTACLIFCLIRGGNLRSWILRWRWELPWLPHNSPSGIGFTNEELLKGAIEIIVDKAQMEQHFGPMYADLCLKLSLTTFEYMGKKDDEAEEGQEGDEEGKKEGKKKKSFKSHLLTRCQEEFEKVRPRPYSPLSNPLT